MAELTDLLAKMQATSTEDAEKEKRQQKIGDRQEKNETAQLDALESLESSFPSAFAAKAEVLVGEKIPFEHSGLLGDIKRGVDGLSLTFGQKFKDFFGSFAGIMPSRPARKRAEAADLAQELIQADTHDIAKAVSESNARGAVEQKERRKKMFGMEGMLARFSGLSALTGKKTGGGKAVEKAREQEAYQNKMLSCCKRTGDAVEELNESFMASMTEKVKKFGLTLILAGIAVIVGFFQGLSTDPIFKWMKAFTGRALRKLFAPIKGLFAEEGFIGKAMKSIKGIFAEEGAFGKAIKSIKGAFAAVKESKFIVGLKGFFTRGWTKLTNFLKPVYKFFDAIVKKTVKLVKIAKDTSKMVKWAGTIGKVLGRLFMPITLAMSLWDLITGAMDAWDKEGKETDSNMVTQFIAAIGGGLGKLAKSLIGIPLGWLTSGIAWIAKKMGFDEASKDIAKFAEKLPDFIYDLVNAPFDYLKKGVKWLTKLFTEGDPVGELKKFWEKLVGTGNWVVNAIGTALDSIWEWFKNLFDFDFSSIITSLVPESVVSAAKSIGGAIADFFGGGEKKPTSATGVLGGGMGPLSHDLGASAAEAERLRKENADVKAKAAGGGLTRDTYTDLSQDNRQETKSTMVALTPTTPNSVIAALAMTP